MWEYVKKEFLVSFDVELCVTTKFQVSFKGVDLDLYEKTGLMASFKGSDVLKRSFGFEVELGEKMFLVSFGLFYAELIQVSLCVKLCTVYMPS